MAGDRGLTTTGDRGQVFTLESVLAALVVLAGLVFAMQAVVVTPSASGASASPADADTLTTVLSKSAENGALERAVLAWDSGQFLGATSGEPYFVDTYPPNDFGTALDEAVGPAVAVNVVVNYRATSGDIESQRLVYNGLPADGAVRSTTTVAVYDSDVLYTATGSPRPGTSASSDGLYPDIQDQSSDLYNVLEVEVVAWRA